MAGLLGARRGREAALIMRIGRVAGLGAGLGALAAVHLAARPQQAAQQAYWRVSGPPCAAASPEDLARIGRPLGQSFAFEDARFSRISGAASCSGVTEKGPSKPVHFDVCQFNSPRAVAVLASGRLHVYQIAGTRPATVTVWKDGAARCVAAANFNGD